MMTSIIWLIGLFVFYNFVLLIIHLFKKKVVWISRFIDKQLCFSVTSTTDSTNVRTVRTYTNLPVVQVRSPRYLMVESDAVNTPLFSFDFGMVYPNSVQLVG